MTAANEKGPARGVGPRTSRAGNPPDTPQNTAELLVEVLIHNGVEVIFLNPGTDTAPVQEALARLQAASRPVPRVVLCPHEALALAAAHAYFAVTARPQVVMVHVDVGTQNLGAMLHNAHRGEIGVLIIAGRTPSTAYDEQPGGRDLPVHWQQDVPDQIGIVRSYVKWSSDVAGPEVLPRQLNRAFQVARTAPPGPVYLTAGREVLMEPTARPIDIPPVERYGPPAPPAPHPGALARVVEVLTSSTNPVITTTRLGRDPEAVQQLVVLAELLGAPVIDRRERVNFPSSHEAYVVDRQQAQDQLMSADVVLAVDADVPWIPRRAAPSDHATIIHVGVDPVQVSTPGWSFPADVCIQADPEITIRLLSAALLSCREGASLKEPRRRPVPPPTERPSVGDYGRPQKTHTAVPPAEAIAALSTALRDSDIVIEEATTNSELLKAHLRRTQPGTLFQSGGSGLGWGLGAAIGAKLADPGSRVVAVVGDGSLLFSSPTAALWTAHRERTPILIVVLQNGGYAASRRPVFDLYPHGASSRAGEVVGTRFPDIPDFVKVAQACHADGERVSAATLLREAFERGLATVDAGRTAVVVVDVESPWIERTSSDSI